MAREESVAIATTVDGVACTLSVGEAEAAVDALRDRLGKKGTRLACGQGVCGACTVTVDGVPTASCVLPATSLHGKRVGTVEGLGAQGLHPVQRAFLAEDALQCGFCTPGMVVEAAAFVDGWRKAHGDTAPADGEVVAAMAGHLCRCGAYPAIKRAITKACTGAYDRWEGDAPRHDAREKVTGAARYTVDVQYEGQLEGRILRSPHAHAKLLRLDTTAAAALPGVRAVVELVPKARTIRFAGQEIVAIAAVDRETAEEAVRRVVTEYEVLPAAVGMDAARSDGAPVLYPGIFGAFEVPSAGELPNVPAGWRGNLRGPVTIFSNCAGDAKKAIAASREAGTLVEGTWRTQAQVHTALEPHACVAKWEGKTLTVHASTQSVKQLARDIAHRWKLREDDVVVLAPYVGGAFGAKSDLDVTVRAAIDLAKAAGAPVRVVLDRREELSVAGNRPPVEMELAVATTPDGGYGGLALRAHGDAGVAVGSNAGLLFRLMYPDAPCALDEYDVVTNGPPGKPFRGPNGPPAFFALEQAVDMAAARRKEDPLALRRRWDSDRLRQDLYDAAAALPMWKERAANVGTGRYRRGVGVAAATWFFYVRTSTEVRVRAGPKGITVATATQDIGQGARSVLADAVAGVFGVRPAEIHVRVGDSTLPNAPYSIGSQTTASILPPALDAARVVRDALVQSAAKVHGLREARPVPGGVAHAGGKRTWAELLHTLPPAEHTAEREDDEVGYFLPFRPEGAGIGKALTSAVQVVEVEVDTRLGKVRVLRSWSGLAVGNIVSPTLARAQVEGGVIQGIGYALYEERRLDPRTGQVLTASLDDYRIPGFGDIPDIDVHFEESGFEGVNGRSLGLGEIVTLTPAAAIANAVYHATGWRPMELPIRPDRVVAGVRR